MTIGKVIKYLRESQGMTQEELGKILGCSDKAVSTWENDLKTPRMGAIDKIAAHFGVLKSDIVDGDVPTYFLRMQDDPMTREFYEMFEALSPEKKRMAWAMMKGLSNN